ncbi:PilZ domain-containing protein [Bermanella sp. R86510]|uniref:PilZ domain-containing protein n=1 Tax=unclassified Bermanella TaxID=2627862 RepID=UPI0037CC6EF8
MSEHRQFTRIEFDADTRVSQGDQIWPVELIDISLNGVLFKQPDDWLINPKKPLFINIHLADHSVIKMEGQLVHISDTEVGCQCKHIDLDSITLLKRLIALNVGSEDLLERELSALIH